MIKLPDIPEDILDKHWNYFINSNGFKRLKLLSYDTSLPVNEMMLYRYLFRYSVNFLKPLICGKPLVLRRLIGIFNNKLNKRIESKDSYEAFWEIVKNQNNVRSLSDEQILMLANDIYIFLKKPADISAAIETFKKAKKKTYSVKDNLQKILKPKLKESKSNGNSTFITRLFSIFDYDTFVKGNLEWGAYKLVEEIGVRVCPYCNRSFIDIVNSSTGKTRPELDHYYPKSVYPFLALSIYNLIPSCHVCNSAFKGNSNFFTDIHCHPYEYSLHDYGKFVLNNNNAKVTVDDIIQHVCDRKNIDISIVHRDIATKSDMFNNTKATFHLDELYNLHKDYALEILAKSRLYDRNRLDDLRKLTVNNIKLLNEVDFPRLILGNFAEPKNFNLRPLSKFIYDIAEESGLLNNLRIKYMDKVDIQ